jgi:26S proteasome regulatory subunit T6
MSLQRGINFRSLAEKMGNCSGAEVRGICTEAGMSFSLLHLALLYSLVLRKGQRSKEWTLIPGMYALRERRQYVGQEDFEMAVAKVLKKNAESNMSVNKLFS